MLLQDLQDESPFHLSAPLVIVFGQIEMMLWVGSSGLRMFCTKKSSSPVRPINSLRVSVGGWEPCESAFLTKGIVSTSLVVRFKAKVDDFLFEVYCSGVYASNCEWDPLATRGHMDFLAKCDAGT